MILGGHPRDGDTTTHARGPSAGRQLRKDHELYALWLSPAAAEHINGRPLPPVRIDDDDPSSFLSSHHAALFSQGSV